MTLNPKIHDRLFKWLITSFTDEFFDHYFPDIKIGKYRFIDKEFINRYEALKETLKGDLFVVMEIEIDDNLQELVIQIEHQGKREDVTQRVYEYSCYAWLLKKKPVWSIVIYTDDAVWRKDVPDSFCYAYSQKKGEQFFHFDIIKVKKEKSEDLIKKHSLLCKLLALKADDRESDPAKLIREIYLATARMKKNLNKNQMLLIEQWINAYKKIPEKTFNEIKKEVNKTMIETTISEHFFNKGKMEGKLEGKLEGEIKGKIDLLENLRLYGTISKDQYESMVTPLREQLKALSQ